MMANLASTPSKHSDQSRYYGGRASAIRARLMTFQDEVFSELYLLAAHCERLAEFAESSGSLASIEELTYWRSAAPVPLERLARIPVLQRARAAGIGLDRGGDIRRRRPRA